MSGIHGVWSAGLLASSGAAVVAAALDTSLVVHFGIVATVVAVASLRLLRGLLNPRAEDVGGERAPHGGSVSWPAVLPLGLIGFCSFLGEGSMHDWSAVYLNETLGASPAIAATGFAGFALGMTVSRFVADRLIVRYGSVRVVRAGGLVASAGLALGLVMPGPAAAIAGFTVLGAALAPVVPTVFSAAGNVGAGATALGWVVTISYVGGILGPGLIGFTAQITGLRIALGIPAALGLVIAALAGGAVTAPGSSRRADVPSPPTEGPW
jgi:fucose permease